MMYNKAIVALVMAILQLIDMGFGIHLPWATELWIGAVLTVLTPIAVYFTPNKPLT